MVNEIIDWWYSHLLEKVNEILNLAYNISMNPYRSKKKIVEEINKVNLIDRIQSDHPYYGIIIEKGKVDDDFLIEHVSAYLKLEI